jgi:hypothetical protein
MTKPGIAILLFCVAAARVRTTWRPQRDRVDLGLSPAPLDKADDSRRISENNQRRLK